MSPFPSSDCNLATAVLRMAQTKLRGFLTKFIERVITLWNLRFPISWIDGSCCRIGRTSRIWSCSAFGIQATGIWEITLKWMEFYRMPFWSTDFFFYMYMLYVICYTLNDVLHPPIIIIKRQLLLVANWSRRLLDKAYFCFRVLSALIMSFERIALNDYNEKLFALTGKLWIQFSIVITLSWFIVLRRVV